MGNKYASLKKNVVSQVEMNRVRTKENNSNATSNNLVRHTFFLSFPLGPITLSKMCFPTCESTALSGSSNK